MKIWPFIVFILTLLACTKEEILKLCNSKDPVNNLEWLKDTTFQIQSDPKYVSVVITVLEYKGQTIFNVYDAISSCAYCDLRDCSGKKYTPGDLNDFVTNKRNERKIWCQNPDLCVN